MDHRVPRAGVVIGIVCALAAAATFIFLNFAFEGPSPIRSLSASPYELKTTLADTELLPTKQPVLVRGVQVGKVTSVGFNKQSSTGTVTFTLNGQAAPAHRDASVTIGEKTIIGDPYVNLNLGTKAAGDLPSGAHVPGRPSVDFDEALSFLDARGRRHLKSTLNTLSEPARNPQNGENLNQTVGGLDRTIHELRGVTDTLHGQEVQIASLVNDSSIVVHELGTRERAIRTIVGSGRVALDALARYSDSIKQGLTELPPLLAAGTRALAESRPLLVEARPLVHKLRIVAPQLRPALAAIGPLSRDAAAVIRGLHPLRVAATPVLKRTVTLLHLALPVTIRLTPALRNLVSLTRYMAPRATSLSAFFANLEGATRHGDVNGKWARFYIGFQQGELTDTPTPAICYPEDDVAVNQGLCQNAYPKPKDALNPEPYVPGSYQRLRAFNPSAGASGASAWSAYTLDQ